MYAEAVLRGCIATMYPFHKDVDMLFCIKNMDIANYFALEVLMGYESENGSPRANVMSIKSIIQRAKEASVGYMKNVT